MLEWFLESEGWTLIAKERARVDLEQALTIWREHIHKIDKSKILIDILYNAPPELHQRAIDELERNFTLEPRHQLYKVPILLDIALRLKQDRPGIAKATAVSTLDIIGERFEKEKRGRLEQSLFLVRIIPELAACDPSLISKAANLVDKIDDKFYYGLKLIPAADLLRLLVKRRDVPSLRYSYRVSQSTGMGDGDIVRDAPPLTDRPLLEDETIEGLNVEIALWHWKRHSREPVLGMLFEYEKWLSETSSALLINLYFLYQVRKGTLDFHTDYIKALLAIKTFPLYSTDVLDFVNLIENEDVRQLTFVDLYHKLPFAMIAQIDGFSRRALQAIAQVRIAARVFHPQRKQKYLDDALMEAEQSLKELQDDFTLDLLIQFVREVRHLDIEQATQLSEQFAIRVIDEVLKIPRAWVDDWKVEQLFELGDCGYHFSSEECTNIQRRSDQWLDKLEMQVEANTEERHYQLSSRLILMAYSTVSANRKRSLALIERATRHVSFLHEKGMRMVQQQRILRFLLASGEASLLEKAVWFSLDGGDLIFNAFDLFGSTLLKMEQEDKELPLRLREVIEWAEQLWRI